MYAKVKRVLEEVDEAESQKSKCTVLYSAALYVPTQRRKKKSQLLFLNLLKPFLLLQQYLK